MASTDIDPAKELRWVRIAYWLLFVIGGLTLLLGLAALFSRVAPGSDVFGNAWFTLAQGAVVLVLGYFTMRGSALALGIATGWYTLLSLLAIGSFGLTAAPIRVVVIFFLVQGFLALRRINQHDRLAASSPGPSPDQPSPPPPAK